MTPEQFLEKVEAGTVTEEDTQAFIEELSSQLTELKQSDPQKYLETIQALTDVTDDLDKALKQIT